MLDRELGSAVLLFVLLLALLIHPRRHVILELYAHLRPLELRELVVDLVILRAKHLSSRNTRTFAAQTTTTPLAFLLLLYAASTPDRMRREGLDLTE